MNNPVKPNKAERVVTPKALESEGESVTLRPGRSASPSGGNVVCGYPTAEGKITADATDKVLCYIRAQRDRDNRGSSR
jgi:hypothetical protein